MLSRIASVMEVGYQSCRQLGMVLQDTAPKCISSAHMMPLAANGIGSVQGELIVQEDFWNVSSGLAIDASYGHVLAPANRREWC